MTTKQVVILFAIAEALTFAAIFAAGALRRL